MNIRQNALLPARKLKHAGFVAAKRTSRVQRSLKFAMATQFARPYTRISPYSFDPSRYRRSFLTRNPPVDHETSELPRRVFVLWTGDNELPPNRDRNLRLIRESIGVPVELVTPGTIDQWVVPGHPLHKGYDFLSLVHRSDYLRAYLLHHHGGGYTDLKRPLADWGEAFDGAERDLDAWITGFRELRADSVSRVPGNVGMDLALHHPRLVGMGSFIVRSHTALTGEWLREVERRMDYYMPQAEEFPGGVRGEVVGYPVSWTRLLGGILHPLQLKYLTHVRINDDLLLDFENYQ